jgi:hypothetical protein
MWVLYGMLCMMSYDIRSVNHSNEMKMSECSIDHSEKILSEKMLMSVVRLEVFTAVTMKNGVFWDVTPCGSCKNRRFGGT